MNWDALKKDWRIWLLIVSLLVSFGLIFNITEPYTRGPNGEYQLNTNIKQGLDLQGGARVIIAPQTDENVTAETMNQIKQTLRTRISAFGLQEMDIRTVCVGGANVFDCPPENQRIQIELAGANTSDLTELINRTGRFEARVPITVTGNEQITLGSETYEAQVQDDTVTIDGSTYQVNDTFTLSTGERSVEMTYTNQSGGTATLSALAFTGEDILDVDTNAQRSGVRRTQNGYTFEFQVSITQEAARRVQDVLQGFPEGPSRRQGGSGNLQGAQLVLYLDDSQVSSLGIANSFKHQPIQEPLITGGAQSEEEARQEMEQLKSVLQSGALPVPVEIISENRVSATLGAEFLRTAILAILVAIAAVAIVVFLRYQDPRIALPLTMTGFSELVMIFGFAAWVGWTIDLPSIAGIIAAIGTGVDDQIIITDERGKERRTKSLKERFKRAFFIIFTSAASTIGAMLPLMKIGAGAIQGFAVTTIAGVLIGVTITRPAYARVLQYMDE